jgi:hypothetical protein
VLVHARQHEHDVDLVAPDDGFGAGESGIEIEASARRAALALVDVVDAVTRARPLAASRSSMPM